MMHLILFDIDGTLLWTNGAGRTALKFALEQVYGTAGALDSINPGGRTIREIIDDMLGAQGITSTMIDQHYDHFNHVMVDKLQQLVSDPDRVQPCPGAPALVSKLATRDDTILGLLTGNPQSTATLKLQAAGYDRRAFRVGAYGNENPVRSELLRFALQRAEKLLSISFHPKQVVVIGDTGLDVACGQEVGTRTIAVATGDDTFDNLVACQPDYVFHDLSDTAAIMAVIYVAKEV